MLKSRFVSRCRFALVALLAAFICVSSVGCGPNPAQQRAAIEKANSELKACLNRFTEQMQEQNRASETDPKKILGDREKMTVECRDAVRAINTNGCPADYKAGLKKIEDSLDAICDYLAKLTSGESKIDESILSDLAELLVDFAESCAELEKITQKYNEASEQK